MSTEETLREVFDRFAREHPGEFEALGPHVRWLDGAPVVLHIYPRDDAIGHTLKGEECVCGPDTESVDDHHRLVIHHSLDGREEDE